MSRSCIRCALVLAIVGAAGSLTAAPAPAAAEQPASRSSSAAAASAVTSRVSDILAALETGGDWAAAVRDLRLLLETLIAYGSMRDLGPWREVVGALRTVEALEKLEPELRRQLLPALRSSPNLAAAMAFSIPGSVDPGPAYRLLARLQRERGEHLERFAALAAAISIVHATPLTDRINENTAAAADPVALFDFFRTTESSMLFGIRDMPVELLVHVVDTTASIEELRWAQGKYKGDRQVGNRFHDIRYDTSAFKRGTPKKVTTEGFNLRNILKYGGICADQAYFACQVGKSIGVPTTYVAGRGAETAHAWVGYLQRTGRGVSWNFDTGRYDAYQVVRGGLRDPRTREWTPDSFLGILTLSMTSSAPERHGAAALVQAARHLGALRREGRPLLRGEPDAAVAASGSPRAASAASQLELLEAAVRQTPGSVEGWFALRDLAAAGDLSLDQLRKWSSMLFQLCGGSYPEFSLEILSPMIASVTNVREQDALWNSALKSYTNSADLVAEIRFQQGRMWEQAQDPAKAWDCYQDVINRFANDSAAAVNAAAECRRMLRIAGKTGDIAPMLENAWRKTRRPKNATAPSAISSNWYRIGQLYATELETAGRMRDAENVRKQIGADRR